MSYDKAIGQLKNGVSRPTLFKLVLPGKFVGRETNDYLEYFCTRTALPSIRYETIQELGHTNQGIVRLQPSNLIFTNPFEITVIENSDFTVHKDMKKWMDETGTNIKQEGGSGGKRHIRLKYYKQIVGDIELIKLELPDNQDGDNEYKEVMKAKFLNAYPMAIGPLQFDTNPMSSALTFKMEFNYESYTTEHE